MSTLSDQIQSQADQIRQQAKQELSDRMQQALQVEPKVDAPSDKTLLYSSSHKQNAYRTYSITSHWFYDTGKIVLRAADPDGDVVTCKAKAPLAVCILSWQSDRWDVPPELPNASLPSTLDAELLASDIISTSIDVEADADTKIYFAAGTYTFLIHNPVKPGDPIPQPSSPPYISKEDDISPSNYVDVFQDAEDSQSESEEE